MDEAGELAISFRSLRIKRGSNRESRFVFGGKSRDWRTKYHGYKGKVVNCTGISGTRKKISHYLFCSDSYHIAFETALHVASNYGHMLFVELFSVKGMNVMITRISNAGEHAMYSAFHPDVIVIDEATRSLKTNT